MTIKIKKVEPLHVGQFMFVRVTTDDGIGGFGEAGTSRPPAFAFVVSLNT